ERPHGYTDASATVASVAMPQQWSVCAGGKSPLPANLEELIDFAGGVSRQRDEARFVKLGCSDYQYPLMRVVIPHRQPCQLTTSESCRVQEHDRQAHVLGTERSEERRVGKEWGARWWARLDRGGEHRESEAA